MILTAEKIQGNSPNLIRTGSRSMAMKASRRTGVISIALLLVTTIIALILARHYHLDVAAVIVSLLGGLPTLWLAWATYRDSLTSEKGLSLVDIAENLAISVRDQWRAEAAARRLNDPFPLPVHWTAADSSLVEDWSSIENLATSGVGWPPVPLPGVWAPDALGLAGEGNELMSVLFKVPTGRLVVLGEPGAGKTMLLVRLVLDLLSHRRTSDPVPVLLSLASWDPINQSLIDWLSAQIMIDYPSLGAKDSSITVKSTRAQALMSRGLILPILDGLDEIPDNVRGPAIARINDSLRAGDRLVVACRTDAYKYAVRPSDGVEITLRGAAGIKLCPLDVTSISHYLQKDAGGPVGAARWDSVLLKLGTPAPVGQALTTPLMVGLARAIYNPRPGERYMRLRDPGELCSADLANRSAVEGHLFDAFVSAAYRDISSGTEPHGRNKSAVRAEEALTFLARHLEYTVVSTDFAWWQLYKAASRLATGLTVGFMVGLAVSIPAAFAVFSAAGFKAAVSGGLIAGAGSGIASGFIIGATPDPQPSQGMRWRLTMSRAFVGIYLGLILWLVTIFIVPKGFVGIVPSLVIGLFIAAETAPSDLPAAANPQAALRRDRRSTLVAGLGGIIAFGIFGGIIADVSGGIAFGILGGLGGVLVFGTEVAWPWFAISRAWLALRYHLPLSLMSFLADAHRRGILRQVGAVYQFKHAELQHRLARRR